MHVPRLAPVLALLIGLSAPVCAHDVMVEKALSLDFALEIARAALLKCRAEGYHVSVTVIDRGGLVKAMLRDDGTGPHTIDTSRRKAFTALTFKVASGDWAKRVLKAPGDAGLKDTAGTIALAGGLPVRSGTDVIGAVGTSGAPGGDKDEACSLAGLTKVAPQLK